MSMMCALQAEQKEAALRGLRVFSFEVEFYLSCSLPKCCLRVKDGVKKRCTKDSSTLDIKT